MNSHDYQQLAHEAEDNAWAATNDDLRARWLQLAQTWLLLAQDEPRRESGVHDAIEAGRKQLRSDR